MTHQGFPPHIWRCFASTGLWQLPSHWAKKVKSTIPHKNSQEKSTKPLERSPLDIIRASSAHEKFYFKRVSEGKKRLKLLARGDSSLQGHISKLMLTGKNEQITFKLKGKLSEP